MNRNPRSIAPLTGSIVPMIAAAGVIVIASMAVAQVSPVTVLQVSSLDHARTEELGVTIVAAVDGIDAEQLGSCLARANPRLDRRIDPSATFSSMRWTDGELSALDDCDRRSCAFNFPPAMVERLAQQPSVMHKRQTYYGLLKEATFGADKQGKKNRIRAHDLADEPCAGGGLHWLLEGRLKPHDTVTWRKFSASKRMRPTTITTQLWRWQAGPTSCVGQTMLFADHYYQDHVALYQIESRGNSLLLRYHSRTRLDIFGSWWARRFKGMINRSLRKYETKRVTGLVNRCVAAARRQSSKAKPPKSSKSS